MKRFILITAALLALTACDKAEVAPAAAAITAQDLKQTSLDVVYASQDDYMHDGQQRLQANVEKLQVVMNAWPTEQQGNQSPCYMQLKLHTVRMLGLLDGLAAAKDSRESDFKFDCRQSVEYQYNQARTTALWNTL